MHRALGFINMAHTIVYTGNRTYTVACTVSCDGSNNRAAGTWHGTLTIIIDDDVTGDVGDNDVMTFALRDMVIKWQTKSRNNVPAIPPNPVMHVGRPHTRNGGVRMPTPAELNDHVANNMSVDALVAALRAAEKRERDDARSERRDRAVNADADYVAALIDADAASDEPIARQWDDVDAPSDVAADADAADATPIANAFADMFDDANADANTFVNTFANADDDTDA